MTALCFSKWVELAEEMDLLLTAQHYDKFVKDEKYKIVQIDFMNFLYQEKKVKWSKVYDPQDLYKDLTHIIKPTKVIKIKNGNVVKTCDTCKGVDLVDDIITSFGIKCPTYAWDFYTSETING